MITFTFLPLVLKLLFALTFLCQASARDSVFDRRVYGVDKILDIMVEPYQLEVAKLLQQTVLKFESAQQLLLSNQSYGEYCSFEAIKVTTFTQKRANSQVDQLVLECRGSLQIISLHRKGQSIASMTKHRWLNMLLPKPSNYDYYHLEFSLQKLSFLYQTQDGVKELTLKKESNNSYFKYLLRYTEEESQGEYTREFYQEKYSTKFKRFVKFPFFHTSIKVGEGLYEYRYRNSREELTWANFNQFYISILKNKLASLLVN